MAVSEAKVSRSGRKSDVACRYGGEEFVLFMPETAAEVALKRADEIREAVRSLRLEWEGQALGPVTLSGVSQSPFAANALNVSCSRAPFDAAGRFHCVTLRR